MHGECFTAGPPNGLPGQMQETTDYLEALHPQPHPLLLELEQHARKDGVTLVSRDTARLLATIVAAMQATRIVEIGTAYGYSTLWMALAQPRIGRIWTIDPDIRRTDVALSYFKRAEEDDFIEIFNTPALELLENFPHRNLDVVFIDANEADYGAYLELAVPMLKLSGVVVVDGCLEDTAGMRAFNEAFLDHPSLLATILPIGNGTGIGARVR
ncbi:MAG: O-methyltransferase [Candidatus Eremiobacteraeota bacterium]|nr:O-methyltransferase [Candidatus Eremiobacteraeota bacterium]